MSELTTTQSERTATPRRWGAGLLLWALVPLVTCTLAVVFGAMSPNEQFRVWLGGLPLMEQVPGPL